MFTAGNGLQVNLCGGQRSLDAMASSTRSRLIALFALILAVVAWREISIRRHEDDLDDWPRRNAS